MRYDAIYQPVPLQDAEAIVNAVCKKFNVTIDELRGRARPWRIVWPRWLLMILLTDLHKWSTPQIARLLGKDHSSVCYGMDEAKNIMKNNPKAALQLKELFEELKSV